MDTAGSSSSILDWACAGRPLHAGDESGDQQVVVPVPQGVLLAVMDGLGHGPEAAAAAREAIRILAHDAIQPALDLIRSCHEALRKTRGVVIALVRINSSDSMLEWCGVGNIEAALVRADLAAARRSASLVTSGGVVGYRYDSPRVSTLAIFPGDTLVLTTDGISAGFMNLVRVEDTPQIIADSILAGFAKTRDDALVLVARYWGRAP